MHFAIVSKLGPTVMEEIKSQNVALVGIEYQTGTGIHIGPVLKLIRDPDFVGFEEVPNVLRIKLVKSGTGFKLFDGPIVEVPRQIRIIPEHIVRYIGDFDKSITQWLEW